MVLLPICVPTQRFGDDAVNMVRNHIQQNLVINISLPSQTVMVTKRVRKAHEAIHPSDVGLTGDKVWRA